MNREVLKQVLADQQEYRPPKSFFARTLAQTMLRFVTDPNIMIISGIRRSGKSTIQRMFQQEFAKSDYYFNFDDERLVQFQVKDFQLLLEVLIERFGDQSTFYFDEIQNIRGWERFVRRLYDQGKKIYLTGSNAKLLSKELGTHLTGRYIQFEVYPLSFQEIVHHKYPDAFSKKALYRNNLKNRNFGKEAPQNFDSERATIAERQGASENQNCEVKPTRPKTDSSGYFGISTQDVGMVQHHFAIYLKNGGIPEYVKFEKAEYLKDLLEGILYRDIITRYKIKDEKSLREVVYYLASNIGKEFSYTNLGKTVGISSPHTIRNYCTYLEHCYLFFFVNRYDYSLRKQIQYNKKCYMIDTAFIRIAGFRISEDRGRLLENIVFLHLRMKTQEIYFHKDRKECDFILRSGNQITQAIQVTTSLMDEAVKKREIEGLLEAMHTYQLQEGLILTETEQDTIKINEYIISVIPIWKWLLDL